MAWTFLAVGPGGLARTALAGEEVASADPAARTTISVEPIPDWVEAREDDTSIEPSQEGSGGTVTLLLDEQHRVTEQRVDRFYRRVIRVVSTAGVEGASELTFEYEPNFQTIAIHHLSLTRDGKTMQALDPSELKTVQRVADLESRIFDARLSVLAFLRDVRPGDEIDYAWSIRGANPILGNRYVENVSLDSDVPVGRLRFRLLWPAHRKLSIGYQGTDRRPNIRETGTTREYRWVAEDLLVPEREDGVPRWFPFYAWLQLSEFQTWEEVARWGSGLFAEEVVLPVALEEEIEVWRKQTDLPLERLLLATRFVQDEVRYLGIEMGEHSHLPHSPAEVFERRYGDCKDKSYLLVTILRRLGIEASPVLVNTRVRAHLGDQIPSAYAFDHAIARAEVDGVAYWIDGTQTYRRGAAASFEQSTLGQGLVLKPGTATLATIRPMTLPAPTMDVEESYEIADRRSPVFLNVARTYRGVGADRMRYRIAHGSLRELGEEWEAKFVGLFSAAKRVGEIVVKDDPAANEIAIHDRYRLPDFWSRGGQVQAWSLGRVLPHPRVVDRRSPFHLPNPVHLRHRITVLLPAPLAPKVESTKVDAVGVRFSHGYESVGAILNLTYELQIGRSEVAPDDIDRYMEGLKKIEKTLGYDLGEGELGVASKPLSTADFVSAGLLLVAGLGIAIWFWRSARTMENPQGRSFSRRPKA